MTKKNTKGGKGHKKAKRTPANENKKIDFKEHDQEYGLILRKLGDCRFEVKCSDGEKRIGHARGKMRKRIWINANDLVLLSLRQDFTNDNKADIISKYSESDGRKLVRMGELSPTFLQAGEEGDNINDNSEDHIEIDYGENEKDQGENNSKKENKNDEVINWDDI